MPNYALCGIVRQVFMLKQWSFSLFLGLSYLAVFHWWLVTDRPGIIVSGVLATIALSAAFILAAKRRYFLNRCDAFFHSLVILDILLEGILIPSHDHYGFYWCALGFALVLGAYRANLIKVKPSLV